MSLNPNRSNRRMEDVRVFHPPFCLKTSSRFIREHSPVRVEVVETVRSFLSLCQADPFSFLVLPTRLSARASAPSAVDLLHLLEPQRTRRSAEVWLLRQSASHSVVSARPGESLRIPEDPRSECSSRKLAIAIERELPRDRPVASRFFRELVRCWPLSRRANRFHRGAVFAAIFRYLRIASSMLTSAAEPAPVWRNRMMPS